MPSRDVIDKDDKRGKAGQRKSSRDDHAGRGGRPDHKSGRRHKADSPGHANCATFLIGGYDAKGRFWFLLDGVNSRLPTGDIGTFSRVATKYFDHGDVLETCSHETVQTKHGNLCVLTTH